MSSCYNVLAQNEDQFPVSESSPSVRQRLKDTMVLGEHESIFGGLSIDGTGSRPGSDDGR